MQLPGSSCGATAPAAAQVLGSSRSTRRLTHPLLLLLAPTKNSTRRTLTTMWDRFKSTLPRMSTLESRLPRMGTFELRFELTQSPVISTCLTGWSRAASRPRHHTLCSNGCLSSPQLFQFILASSLPPPYRHRRRTFLAAIPCSLDRWEVQHELDYPVFLCNKIQRYLDLKANGCPYLTRSKSSEIQCQSPIGCWTMSNPIPGVDTSNTPLMFQRH